MFLRLERYSGGGARVLGLEIIRAGGPQRFFSGLFVVDFLDSVDAASLPESFFVCSFKEESFGCLGAACVSFGDLFFDACVVESAWGIVVVGLAAESSTLQVWGTDGGLVFGFPEGSS